MIPSRTMFFQLDNSASWYLANKNQLNYRVEYYITCYSDTVIWVSSLNKFFVYKSRRYPKKILPEYFMVPLIAKDVTEKCQLFDPTQMPTFPEFYKCLNGK